MIYSLFKTPCRKQTTIESTWQMGPRSLLLGELQFWLVTQERTLTKLPPLHLSVGHWVLFDKDWVATPL